MEGARRGPAEIAAAVGVVLTGVALIAGILLKDPRWQRIFASWPRPPAIRLEGLEVQPPAIVSPAPAQRLAPGLAPPQPVPLRPARAEPNRSATRPPSGAQPDSTQVMATLLVSQLGQDAAWRTAMANADVHAADSPEHVYWRAVATAIRDGLRPRQ